MGWIRKEYENEFTSQILTNPFACFDEGNVVKWHKNQRNRLAEVNWLGAKSSQPKTVVLKSYQASSFYNSLRLRLGSPRAVRHWDRVWLLNSKGINTPQPVFVVLPASTRKSQGLIAVETVTEHQRIREILSSDVTVDSELLIGTHSIKAGEFVRICGQYARQIHDQSIAHRDFSGANILVPSHWDGTNRDIANQFVLLDINRVRLVADGDMSINLRIQDLERLFMPECLLESYYFAYAGDNVELQENWQKFLKYRKGYRRIRESENSMQRALLKTFTYWPRTG